MIFIIMWNMLPSKKENESLDEKKVRHFSYLHFLLVAFIVIWMVGAYLYLNKKVEREASPPAVYVVDRAGAIEMTNFFLLNKTNSVQMLHSLSNSPSKAQILFEVKDSYQVGDVVVVNFMNRLVVAQVIDTPLFAGHDYTVIYQNHLGDWHPVKVPKAFLMAPASPEMMNFLKVLDN